MKPDMTLGGHKDMDITMTSEGSASHSDQHGSLWELNL